jgi:hypothetical protein
MAERKRASRRLAVPSTALAVLATITALFAPSAGAASPGGPAWQLAVVSYPTSFAPGTVATSEHGPGYEISAVNVGAAASSGELTITDTLPPGIRVAPTGVSGEFGYQAASGPLSCEVAGEPEEPEEEPVEPVVVTCRTSEPIPAGQGASVLVPLRVPLTATAVLTTQASVEGGGAAAATGSLGTMVTTALPSFGFVEGTYGAYGTVTGADGAAVTEAGSHPFQLTVGMNFRDSERTEASDTMRTPDGGLREVNTALARGIVIDPQSVPRCKEVELESPSRCPAATQVGTVRVTLSLTGSPYKEFVPIFNMVPPPGYPASLGFEVLEVAYIHLLGRVRSNGDYGLSGDVENIPAKVGALGTEVTLWGSPTDESHDSVREPCITDGGSCAVERRDTAFLSLPSSCSGNASDNVLRIKSWEGRSAEAGFPLTDLSGAAERVSGCNSLRFEPTVEAQPTTDVSDSPSGLRFRLHQPQDLKYDHRSTANLKDTKVTLPVGMSLNPAAGDGLEACTQAELGSNGAEPPHCPEASKIGTVEVKTPLLADPLPGSVYLAKPFDNPFSSLLAIYLAIDDEQTGVVVKLPAKVEADPVTGQLTTTVEESPELPLEDVSLDLFKGARAPLTTPLACGTHTAVADLTPWSAPEGATVERSDSFQTSVAADEGDCPASEAAAPDAPTFSAGTVEPSAGAFSPFTLKVTRADGSQRLTSIDTTLPEGLVGRLAGIPYCSDGAIAQAESRSHPDEGMLERQNPSCPLASEVGVVNVSAGSGPSPIYVQGHAYLAGPYKGAPLSLAIVTPAVAGPFDLGTVVTRVALLVNLETAQIHAVSDPLPTVLYGIPLDVRSIALNLDRTDFTLNPTSCNPMAVTGSATSATGSSAALSERFQVGGCSALAFKPKVKLQLKGQTKRSGHPALKAVVTFPKKGAYANIARAQVGLPHSEFLDQANLDKVCTQPQLKSDTCPAKSIYGHAKAWTPLLEKPLEGPVYLGVGFGHKLPDVVADLNGQIRILLHGRVDTTKHDGIRNTFEVVPDAPVSRFVLEMKGGKKYGLLQNSENICRKTQKASARFVAQNGKAAQLRPKIKNSCKRKKKNKGSKKRHHGR